jgi:hypothetical protein
MQHTTRNTQHRTRNVQHATYNMQRRRGHNMQRGSVAGRHLDQKVDERRQIQRELPPLSQGARTSLHAQPLRHRHRHRARAILCRKESAEVRTGQSRRCDAGHERGTDVGPVPAQMLGQSQRRCGRSPGADVGAVPTQMWASPGADVGAVPAQMWAQSRRRCWASPCAAVGAGRSLFDGLSRAQPEHELLLHRRPARFGQIGLRLRRAALTAPAAVSSAGRSARRAPCRSRQGP